MREHNASDVKSYFDILSDNITVRYYGKLPLTKISEAQEDIVLFQKKYEQGSLIKWAVEESTSEKYIGCVGAFGFNDPHFRVTISCIFNSQYWHKGYAKEALLFVLEYLFKEKKINRVQVYVDPINQRAVNLFMRLGFLNEGILRDYEYEYGEPVNLMIMSILKKEWNLKRSY